MYKKGLRYCFEIDEKPNIDINKVSYEVEDNLLYLYMWVEGEIVADNKTIYSINFGEHHLSYSNYTIFNSSSYINHEISTNSIKGIFKLNDSENISTNNLTGIAFEYMILNDNSNLIEVWMDMVPDEYPPYIFWRVGAGRFYSSFGRGIHLEINNMHDINSVNCSFEAYFNGTYGFYNSHINTTNIIIYPKSSWTYSTSLRGLPFICNVTLFFTISDFTFLISGFSIGQWYFFISDSNFVKVPYDITIPQI